MRLAAPCALRAPRVLLMGGLRGQAAMCAAGGTGGGASFSRPVRPSIVPALLSAAMSTMSEHKPIAERTMAYLDGSPDPFWATEQTCRRLEAAGFSRLDERDAWTGKLTKGGKYFFTRNRSCVVAFSVGGKYEAGNGFKVIGAHTDSPNLKVKPRSKRGGSGCLQIDVECYGGGLWHTWFDRDLSICGRVMVRNGETGGVEQRLVKVERPILRVPNLAIHLQSADERDAFKVNKEDHLQPILALEAKKGLEGAPARRGRGGRG